MKTFFAFIKKETFHILRDTRTLVIILGLPIIQIILFGFAITNEINDAHIVILDQSRDQATRDLTQRMLSSGFFLLDSQPQDMEAVEGIFQRGRVKMAIVFPPDFQAKFLRQDGAQVQLIADATDPNTATSLINYASAIIRDYQLEQANLQAIPMRIRTDVKMLYNEELKSVFMFVPGVMTVILMLISAMMTSIAITREKELGTMEVLLVSPLQPFLIVVGKVVPYVALAFLDTILILLLGTLVFEMPIRGSLWLLLAECLLFIFTSLALGILISTRTSSQQVALMISLMGLMLPTILLSGFIFPVENMPRVLQMISNLIPARWFIIIAKDIMLKGVGFAYIWKETLILGIMTLVLTGLSIRNFKIRLD